MSEVLGNRRIARRFSILSMGCARPAQEPSWQEGIPATMRRRDPRIWHLAWTAADRALKEAPKPASVAAATSLGSLDETRAFLEAVFTTGLGSPRNFIASVHNSMAGKLAMEFGIRGPNLTFCDGPNSLASAIAACDVLNEEDFPVLVVAVEENTPFLKEISGHLPASCAPFLRGPWEEAAVALLLDKRIEDCGTGIRAVGPRPMNGCLPEEQCRAAAAQLDPGPYRFLSPQDHSQSAVAPAIAVVNRVQDGIPGRYVIGSFSPSAKSAAVVELCI